MLDLADNIQRKTATDIVFNELHDEILSLKLLPGTKLSEADIAQRFGVSRQPVRDAFNRLENMDLLLIRPQRATEVRGFSMRHVAHARFVRLSVELEVIRHACSIWNVTKAEKLDENLRLQEQSVSDKETEQFHLLDYQFHKLICEMGELPLAFNTIQECKQRVDRLCVLSLDRKEEFSLLLDDHYRIADGLKRGSADDATSVARKHFARLDDTITYIHQKHSEYFE